MDHPIFRPGVHKLTILGSGAQPARKMVKTAVQIESNGKDCRWIESAMEKIAVQTDSNGHNRALLRAQALCVQYMCTIGQEIGW